jgi:hypothetical protein
LENLPLDVPNTTPANENKIVSAADFKNASFNLMNFTGKWQQLCILQQRKLHATD